MVLWFLGNLILEKVNNCMFSKLSYPLSHPIVFFELLPSIYIKSICSSRKNSTKRKAPPPLPRPGSKTIPFTRYVSLQGYKHMQNKCYCDNEWKIYPRKVQIERHPKFLPHSQGLTVIPVGSKHYAYTHTMHTKTFLPWADFLFLYHVSSLLNAIIFYKYLMTRKSRSRWFDKCFRTIWRRASNF